MEDTDVEKGKCLRRQSFHKSWELSHKAEGGKRNFVLTNGMLCKDNFKNYAKSVISFCDYLSSIPIVFFLCVGFVWFYWFSFLRIF